MKLFILMKKIFISIQDITKKILNRKNYQRKYPLESLKFVYPWIFLEPHYITSKTEHRNYSSRVHFEFDGEKKYDSWGACISIEEAGKL